MYDPFKRTSFFYWFILWNPTKSILHTPLLIPNNTLLRKSDTILFFCSTGVWTGVGVLAFTTTTCWGGGRGAVWVEILDGGGASNCRLGKKNKQIQWKLSNMPHALRDKFCVGILSCFKLYCVKIKENGQMGMKFTMD